MAYKAMDEKEPTFFDKLKEGLRLDFGCESGLKAEIEKLKQTSRLLREDRSHLSLGPGCHHIESDIRSAYGGSDDEIGDKIVLCLKLALSLTAFGQDSTHIEDLLFKIGAVLEIPLDSIAVTPKEIRVSFCGYSVVHCLACSEGVTADKASDVFNLAACIEAGEHADVLHCLEILDAIAARRSAHGWIWGKLAWMIFPFIGCCVFGGDITDACIALSIQIILMLIEKISQCCGDFLAGVYGLLVPITVGVLTPLIGGRYLNREPCHFPSIIIGLHLLYVPGIQLIRAAYEVLRGSRVNGGSRMVSAVLQLMFLATGITIGWQAFAQEQDLPQDAIAYVVPTTYCSPVPFEWWQVVFFWLTGLMTALSIILNIRLGELPIFYVLGWLALGLMFKVTVFIPHLPAYPINAVAAFAASFVAMAYQYVTGKTWFLPVTAIVCLLAPGASALLETLKGFDQGAGPSAAWFDMLMMGVSWAFGLHFAEQLWAPLLQRQLVARVASSRKNDHVESHRMQQSVLNVQRRAVWEHSSSMQQGKHHGLQEVKQNVHARSAVAP